MIRQVVAWTALCGMMAGCADEVLNRTGGDGEGRLILSGIEVESVVGDVRTKASLSDEVIPGASDFTITIVDAATEETVKTLQPGVEAGCFLPVGEYVVKASYGEEAGMSATPYFYGESDKITIVEGETETASLTASLACAVIHPVIPEELEGQYEFYTLTVSETADARVTSSQTLTNDADFFVSGGEGKTYNLILAGQNKLGEAVSHAWSYDNLVKRTRYIIQCDPDLPAFTLPEQSEGNVWSKFLYITPMTAEDMTAHKEDMADKVIDNVVYEASADNGVTWIASEKTEDDRYVIKGLEPSTEYTVRSRFGGVLSSNTQTVMTESAQEIANGDMETYSETEVFDGAFAAWCTAINCVYFGDSWSTRNEKTVDGAQNANGTNNYGLYWRWCSGTTSTTDKSEGNRAAEISTLAFYNEKFSGTVGPYLWDNKRSYVYSKRVNSSGTAYVGYLFTGTFDKTTDTYTLGIPHSSRPISLSFDYKYAPVASDQCIAYAKVYDTNMNEIASTVTFNSSTQDSYITQTLSFVYAQTQVAAAYIGIFFQSGTDTNIGNMKQVEGSYTSTPWKQDRVVGSVLKIDNVTLNYDYE